MLRRRGEKHRRAQWHAYYFRYGERVEREEKSAVFLPPLVPVELLLGQRVTISRGQHD